MPDPHTTQTLVLAHTDQAARGEFAAQLDLDGYAVHEANRTTNTVALLERARPVALLLGALEQPAAEPRLLRALRAGELPRIPAGLPVLTLGPGDAVTQLRAYEDGSDHHLAEELSYATVRAILAAVLRRTASPTAPARERYEIGALRVDVATRQVSIAGEPVRLTAMEFELLRTLASDPERVWTKAELLQRIWGFESPGKTRTLDSHACRLRRRLAAHGQQLVRTRWGVGYALIDPATGGGEA